MSGEEIKVELRVPFEDANGFTGYEVHLNTGASFKSWDAKSYDSGEVFAKGDWVKVVDGSQAETQGSDLIEGQVISLRDDSIWVHNPET
ncbi:MAG: hypothetical protein HRT94_04705 [Alphaproteobacteria bacterium]|nr:hypothetical protein [Alphaproteobacteria bacterium]